MDKNRDKFTFNIIKVNTRSILLKHLILNQKLICCHCSKAIEKINKYYGICYLPTIEKIMCLNCEKELSKKETRTSYTEEIIIYTIDLNIDFNDIIDDYYKLNLKNYPDHKCFACESVDFSCDGFLNLLNFKTDYDSNWYTQTNKFNYFPIFFCQSCFEIYLDDPNYLIGSEERAKWKLLDDTKCLIYKKFLMLTKHHRMTSSNSGSASGGSEGINKEIEES